MNKRKVWVLLITLCLVAPTAAWAAQTGVPSKSAPAKEPAKGAAPKTPAKSDAAAGKSAKAEKPKEHQATGTVNSFSDTSVVISKTVGKTKSDWSFVRDAKTKVQGTLVKDAKVTVYYHEDKDQKVAHRVKLLEAKTEAKPPAKSDGAPAAKSKKSKP